MTELWKVIQSRYDQLSQKLADPHLDPQDRLASQKELARLTTVLNQKKAIDRLDAQVIDLEKQLASTNEPEMRELFEQEIAEEKKRFDQAKAQLDDLMFPPDKHDNRSVYLEIRAGAGGQEAALFVANLLNMYTNYALSKHWKVSVESASDTDLGGYKDVVLYIKGKDVYGHLKR